ncbi:sensor histidine kinase [Comamonas sp. J-3]|uniref:sensor histidine kinase n=1 Tax=Comamonas trifloxystrobinivorans TaxID=3350256 RepID=UPI003727FA2D
MPEPRSPLRHGLQYRLTLAATLLFVAATLVVVWQLLVLQRELSQRDGENMVWALSQAQHEATVLELGLTRFEMREIDAEALELQSDLLFSRLSLLRDGPQRRSLERYQQMAALEPAIAAFEKVDTLQLLAGVDNAAARQPLHALIAALAKAGNQVMVRERVENSQQLDRLARLIRAAFVAAGMVVLCGGWLLWQLLAALRRQRVFASTIEAQRDTLQQTVDELERAQNATETYRNFVSLVSHQFRTPLAVIDSAAQRLIRTARQQGAAPTEQLIERMGETRHTIEGLTRLLDSVLTSVKLEAGGIQLQAQPLNLAELVERVVANGAPWLGGRELQLSREGELGDYQTAGDPELLTHVLLNLLGNACKYTAAGSPLSIRLSRQPTQLLCTVRDWGPGVSASDLPHLFERFFRSSNAAQLPGSGLGLYLARSIAQLHGGDLQASLPEGGGLAITLSLPVAQV